VRLEDDPASPGQRPGRRISVAELKALGMRGAE
jgi:hypothetical protein